MNIKKIYNQTASYKQSIICTIGTIFEWYDITIVAALSPYLSVIFFPNLKHSIVLLYTFFIFASSFIARPLGAAILGHFGDKISRKRTLSFTMILMSISSLLIGCLPGYKTIGVIAPILLFTFRFTQGLAISGDHAGSIIYLCETSLSKQHGFRSSLSFSGIMTGSLLASISVFILNSILSREDMLSWGWRIPFFLSIFLSGIGYYIRNNVIESPVIENILKKKLTLNYPIVKVISHYKEKLFVTLLILASTYTIFYTILFYIPIYLNDKRIFTVNMITIISCINLLIMALLIPIIGYLSDRISYKLLMKIGNIGFIIFSLPLFIFMRSGNKIDLIITLILISIFNALYLAPSAKLIVTLFPPSIRYTAIALVFNLAGAFFGGSTPFMMNIIDNQPYKNTLSFSYIFIISIISYFLIAHHSNKLLYKNPNIEEYYDFKQ